MSRSRALPLLLSTLFLAGGASTKPTLPSVETLPAPSPSSKVLAGRGRAYHHVKGEWVAVPAYDYEFVVLERRYADRWETTKEIHRRHPKYDGRAGPRDQTLWFVVRTSPSPDGGLDLAVEGTLGRGTGHEKPGGGGVVLELSRGKKSLFVPFDTVRIRQQPAGADGQFRETVELFSRKDGSEVPFMKMEEEGLVYAPAYSSIR
jgi:hypothetical protein